jgi:hypothetical protein
MKNKADLSYLSSITNFFISYLSSIANNYISITNYETNMYIFDSSPTLQLKVTLFLSTKPSPTAPLAEAHLSNEVAANLIVRLLQRG